jgi:alpha-N-arabinofuranosidase
MANIAQLVNNLQSLFLADGDRFVATPNFHVFAMYRPHQGAKSLRIKVETPEVSFGTGGRTARIVRVAGSASRGDAGLTLTLVHTHATEPAEVTVRLRGGAAGAVRQTLLTHESLNAHNTFEHPDEVTPRTIETELRGAAFVCKLPAASVTRLDVKLS